MPETQKDKRGPKDASTRHAALMEVEMPLVDVSQLGIAAKKV